MILEKYESTGNDFLITTIDHLTSSGVEFSFEIVAEIARKVCSRHFGIGADGLLILGKAGLNFEGFGKFETFDEADCRMYLVNSDGSRAEMSGNGTRCFGAFAISHGFGNGRSVVIETLAGIKSVTIEFGNDGEMQGEVDMGRVLTRASDIPVVTPSPLDVPLELLGKTRRGIAVNSGVPHWVILVDSRDELESAELADQALSARFDPRFPNLTNVCIVLVESKSRVISRVFERGADETLSCGTGATAIAAALSEGGIAHHELDVCLRGGELKVHKSEENHWFLSGLVRKIARCEFTF